jgi:cell division protein FtsQ
MRPMNRLARRAQAALRRPARPAWVVPLRKVGFALGAMLVVGLSADIAWRSTPVQAAVSAVRGGALGMAARQGLVVRDVLAEGAVQTDRLALLQMLAQFKDQNILTVDIGQIRDRLGRLPWVREVSVTRELPDRLRVRLVEHRAVARWHDGTRQVLVSETGGVIPVPAATRFGNLPLLFGKGAPQRAGELLKILDSEPELRPHVSYAQLVEERRWNVYMDGRVEVRLPEQGPEKAWRRLAAQQQQTGLLGRAIKSVDLRHSAWLTLELADELWHSGKEPGA